MSGIEKRMKEIRERVSGKSKGRSNIEFFGILLILLIFVFLVLSSLLGENSSIEGVGNIGSNESVKDNKSIKDNQTEQVKESKNDSIPLNAQIPSPKIILFEPENEIYATSLVPLKFRVYGPYLDTVLVSVGGEENVSISHDGYIAEVNAYLKPILIETFKNESRFYNEYETEKGDDLINIDCNEFYGSSCILKMRLEGKGSNTKVYKDLKYDGNNNFWISVDLKIDKHKSPGGAFLYVRGYDSDDTERVKIIYHTYENWDTKTSTPEENGKTFYALKKHIGNPELNKWIKIVVNPKEDFEERFPNVWNKLNLMKIRIELSSWCDGEIVSKYANLNVYNDLSMGNHSLLIYANNSIGDYTIKKVNFTLNLNNTKSSYTIGDTIKKGSFAVKLIGYYPFYSCSISTVSDKSVEWYSAVKIEVKNIGSTERSLTFDSKTVIVDDLGNQYEYVKLDKDEEVYVDSQGNQHEEIKVTKKEEIYQGYIYPGVKKKGILLFKPDIHPYAKKVKIIIFLDDNKYVFETKA